VNLRSFDKIAYIRFLFVLAGVLFNANAALWAQSQAVPAVGPAAGRPPIKSLISKYSGMPPLGDSEKRPVESAVQASGRAALERLMGGPDFTGFFGTIEDPGLIVNPNEDDTAFTILDKVGEEAIPDAHCVVVGVVSEAAAFLSPNRKYVYSEFRVKVETVLKQDETERVGPGDFVLTNRTGGSLRFPSGHIKHYIIYGQGFPAVGGRYVFFLSRWGGMVGRYFISAAYQLKDGAVLGLDDAGWNSSHNGMAEEEFLKEVRAAIQARAAK
jgi:hypothetical protein